MHLPPSRDIQIDIPLKSYIFVPQVVTGVSANYKKVLLSNFIQGSPGRKYLLCGIWPTFVNQKSLTLAKENPTTSHAHRRHRGASWQGGCIVVAAVKLELK